MHRAHGLAPLARVELEQLSYGALDPLIAQANAGDADRWGDGTGSRGAHQSLDVRITLVEQGRAALVFARRRAQSLARPGDSLLVGVAHREDDP